VLLKLLVTFGKFGKWCYQHRTNSTARTSARATDNTVAVTYAHLGYSKTVTLKSKLWTLKVVGNGTLDRSYDLPLVELFVVELPNIVTLKCGL